MKQSSKQNRLGRGGHQGILARNGETILPQINTAGAGKINKPANAAAALAILLILILGTSTNLFASVTSLPSLYFYILACCAVFAVGYAAGGKLEFDRLFTLVCSLGWVAGAVVSMCSKSPSALAAAGLCIAFGTAAGGRSLYNFLVLGGTTYTGLQIAMEDLQRARERNR
jgi:hypothetical protein